MVAIRETMRKPAPDKNALRVVAPSAPQTERTDQQIYDIILFGERVRRNGHAHQAEQTSTVIVPSVHDPRTHDALTVLGREVVTEKRGLREETLYVEGDHPHLGLRAPSPYTSVETRVTSLTLPEVVRKRKVLENPHFGRTKRLPAVGREEHKREKKTYKRIEIQVFPEQKFLLINNFLSRDYQH